MTVLRTARLTLRPPVMADAPAIQQLAGAYEVALNTLLIPHPYPDGAAEEWIPNVGPHTFVIDDGELAGVMGLTVKANAIAEIGYWIGKPFWGRGYATEAGREVLRYAFEDCRLQRVYAGHFARNPASGRVLQKMGMTYEGTLRRHEMKWGEYQDLVFYGVLAEEFLSA